MLIRGGNYGNGGNAGEAHGNFNNPRSISNVNVGLFSAFLNIVRLCRNTRAAQRTERRKGAYFPACRGAGKTKISMNTVSSKSERRNAWSIKAIKV